MGPVSGIVTYFCIWWTILFCTLPIGVQQEGVNEVGNLPGAPKNPDLRYKLILTTILSAVVWLIIFALIEIEIINFYEIAAEMSAEDRE